MDVESRRSLAEGAGLGLVAGLVFGALQVIVATAAGASPIDPFRFAASVALGEVALDPLAAAGPSDAATFLIGTAIHLGLSALFGLGYGAVNALVTRRTRGELLAQAGLGMLFGLVLWLVNVEGIARLAYPWFLETSPVGQATLHAVGYGLPLGLLYGTAEARAHRLAPARRRA